VDLQDILASVGVRRLHQTEQDLIEHLGLGRGTTQIEVMADWRLWPWLAEAAANAGRPRPADPDDPYTAPAAGRDGGYGTAGVAAVRHPVACR
jgi:hypothetical protein